MSTYQIIPPIAPNMPPDVQEGFEWCHSQHCRTRLLYRMCHQAYNGDPLTAHVFRQAAGTFFAEVFKSFYNEMYVAICRLTDRIKIGKYETAGFLKLIQLIKTDRPNDVELHDDLQRSFDDALAKSERIRELRDKILSHLDHAFLTDPQQQMLLTAGNTTFDAIYNNFDDLLNRVQTSYGGDRIPDDCWAIGADADRLVSILKKHVH
jgi:hypothetical protein